jgi:hypothetical protein
MNYSRALIFAFLLFGIDARLFAVEPLPPLDLTLDPDVIQSIGLHPQVDLVLVFPDEVTLITGQGLSSGEVPGKVQFQQGKENPGILTLRQLDPKADVLMQVVVKKQVFVFHLKASAQPPTVVRFKWDPKKDPANRKAREISKEEAKKKKAPVSMERIKQMADLVGQEPNLRAKLPEAYANYQSLEANFASQPVKGLTLQIHRIARFSEEDTLVFFGSLKNKGTSSYRHAGNLASIKVGEERVFKNTKLLQTRSNTPPGESSFVWLALVGDGKGKPLHLSLQNTFSIQLHP